MRIVFLLTQDLESPSGLGRYWPLAKELGRLGFEVVILALHSNYGALPPQGRTFVKHGVQVHYVSQMHVKKVGSQKLYFKPISLGLVLLQATLRLCWRALCEKADLYYVGKPHPMNGLAGVLASTLRRKPLYIDCDDYEAATNRFGNRWQRIILAFFEQQLPKLADKITFNTDFIRSFLIDRVGISDERMFRLPNGVDRDRFAAVNLEDVSKLRADLRLHDKKVILYVGSLSLASHAVDLLVEALVYIQSVEPRAMLLLVGGGEDYDRLHALVTHLGVDTAVLFTGRVPPEIAPLYYYLADVVVDPIHDDPGARARFPLKMVEGLAVGVPIVTGDSGDRRRILADGAAGILVAPGDSQALAEGILKVLQHPELAERMRNEAHRLAGAYYWDVLAADFVEVVEA